MIQLSKEQYERLKVYEPYLYSAYYADYIRCLSQREANELLEISIELGFQKTNLSCGACRLNLCKNLGRIYYSQEQPKVEEPKKSESKKENKKKKMFGLI